jgi:hypothetical protein
VVVNAGMAMMPDRFPASLQAVESLKGQVNKLFLCLNNFDTIPQELQQPWIEVWHVGENIGDRGKFYFPTEDYDAFITCDDDLIYPTTFVKDFIKTSEIFQNSVLTHAGKIIPPKLNDYWRDCPKVVTCFTANTETIKVDIPITAACYFPSEIYKKFQNPNFWNCGDFYAMQQARKQNVDCYAITHPAKYFGYIKPPKGTTIWEQTQKVDMTTLLKSFL